MLGYYSSMVGLQKNLLGFNLKGVPSGVYTSNTVTYTSTIDPSINDLYLGYSYDTGWTNLPICLVMHGWNQSASTYYGEITERIASYGYFAISVGMRGRDGASGARDGSARELYDIYDAIQYIKSSFNTIVNGDSIVACGWSGGGGNAYGFVSKFPDLCQVLVSNFGMSDYGYDVTDGWYYTNTASYGASIVSSIGVITDKNTYRARYAIEQISNFKGYSYIFHDEDDATVDVINSQNMHLALTNNHEYIETTAIDDPRWIHQTPTGVRPITEAEQIWKNKIFTQKNKIVSKIGAIKVNGYVVTKRFTIWLGDGVASADNGTNRTATVDYNTITGEYDVTPIFEGSATDCEVIITQGGLSKTQTITTQTILTVT
ncbi:MAG: alpha/beta hydrolase family protein [Flavobacteriaceae bacterium]